MMTQCRKSAMPFPKVLLKKKIWFSVVVLLILVLIYVGLRLRKVTKLFACSARLYACDNTPYNTHLQEWLVILDMHSSIINVIIRGI